MKQAIGGRLSALLEIGLGYLTLDRSMETLSGGEAQRCKIAKYINSSLSDMLYVLMSRAWACIATISIY